MFIEDLAFREFDLHCSARTSGCFHIHWQKVHCTSYQNLLGARLNPLIVSFISAKKKLCFLMLKTWVLHFIVLTSVTKVTEYLCLGGFFLQTVFEFLTSHF